MLARTVSGLQTSAPIYPFLSLGAPVSNFPFERLRNRHSLEPLAWQWSHWPGILVSVSSVSVRPTRGRGCLALCICLDGETGVRAAETCSQHPDCTAARGFLGHAFCTSNSSDFTQVTV